MTEHENDSGIVIGSPNRDKYWGERPTPTQPLKPADSLLHHESNGDDEPQVPTDLAERIGMISSIEDREKKSELVRGILDDLEKSPLAQTEEPISQHVTNLETNLNNLPDRLKNEAIARLALRECNVWIKKAGGFIRHGEDSKEKTSIPEALVMVGRLSKALNAEIVETLMFEMDNGIAGAWNLLQDTNTDYGKMLAEAKRKWELKGSPSEFSSEDFELEANDFVDDDIQSGTVKTCHYFDKNRKRKKAVTEYMADKLVDNGVPLREALRNLRLAESLAEATLETSKWNKELLSGVDQLGDCMGLWGLRSSKYHKGELSSCGPEITIDYVKGFGKSFFDLYIDGGVTVQTYAEDINIQEIGRGSYASYGEVYLKKYNRLREILLERNPSPKQFDEEGGQKWFEEAEKLMRLVDPDDEESMRSVLAYGTLDMALSNGLLGWTNTTFSNFRELATRVNMGPDGPFMTKEQWEYWIDGKKDGTPAKEFNYSGRRRKLNIARSQQNYRSSRG